MRYLFYITQNYSFEILRPIQAEARRRGDEVIWLATGDEVNLNNFTDDEVLEQDLDKARAFIPDACFVPGNNVPSFISGLKVQVFHGLEWKKKGHFVIRDFFDLYCTHGMATTSRFNTLANKHGYFDVVETGWPKLDHLFTTPAYADSPTDKPTILYAPTFSPSLTSAPSFFETIKTLSQQSDYHWLIKFHPKMDKSWVDKYRQLNNDNLQVVEVSDINALMQRADIMVSDTSSVIGEFSLLSKPVVTLNNSQPGDYLIDIKLAKELPRAIEQAFNPSAQLLNEIEKYAQELHPYNDGQSAQRILDAVEKMDTDGKKAQKNKPLNLIRNFQLRKKLNYWKW